jgi:hypothetical protein
MSKTTTDEKAATAQVVEKTFDERKRESNRRHKLKQDAKKAGLEPVDYVKRFFGVTVEEYVTDAFYKSIQRAAGGAKDEAPIDELLEKIQVDCVDMNTVAIEKKNLKPIKTGTALDRLLSREGGFKPGTVNIITGESGAGKTTICTNACVYAKRENKKLEAGCLHAEMSMLDWEEECEKNAGLRELPAVFMRGMNKYRGNEYLAAVKKALMQWKLCVVDSLAVVSDRIKEQTGMSSQEAMFWLIDTMNELAEKELRCYLVIQHFTKGSEYVGPTRVKHDTTSMAYVMFDKNKEPFIIFNKNRRGGGLLHMPLYTSLGEDGMLKFDESRLNDMLEDKRVAKVREEETRKGRADLQQIISLEQEFVENVNRRTQEEGEDDEDL